MSGHPQSGRLPTNMSIVQLVTANYTPGGYKEHAEPALGGYKKNQKLIFVFGLYSFLNRIVSEE